MAFTKKFNKIALNANDDKIIMQSMDSTETYA